MRLGLPASSHTRPAASFSSRPAPDNIWLFIASSHPPSTPHAPLLFKPPPPLRLFFFCLVFQRDAFAFALQAHQKKVGDERGGKGKKKKKLSSEGQSGLNKKSGSCKPSIDLKGVTPSSPSPTYIHTHKHHLLLPEISCGKERK